jgi:hypothetical protein
VKTSNLTCIYFICDFNIFFILCTRNWKEKSTSTVQEWFKVAVGRTVCFGAKFCASLEKDIEKVLRIWTFEVMYVTMQQLWDNVLIRAPIICNFLSCWNYISYF